MATLLSLCHLPLSIHKLTHSKPRKKPPPPPSAVLSSKDEKKKTRLPYELKKGQTRLFHELPSGLSMEVIVQERNRDGVVNEGKSNNRPPLVFVHGSYHAAWCWAEHWLPFFSSHGFDCYALSLLGQVQHVVAAFSILFVSRV